MQAEISPEPPPEERDVVVRALAQLAAEERGRDQAESAWWHAGVRENVEREP